MKKIITILITVLIACSQQKIKEKYEFEIIGEYKPVDIPIVLNKLKKDNCPYKIDKIHIDLYEDYLEYYVYFKEIEEDNKLYSYGRSLWIKDQKITTDNGYEKALRVIYLDDLKVTVPALHKLFDEKKEILEIYAKKALSLANLQNVKEITFGQTYSNSEELIVISNEKTESIRVNIKEK